MTDARRIAVAVVESDGHVLVGVRPPAADLAGYHEFPGGKCESDETPRAAVVRECREETGLVVIPRDHLMTVSHSYDHGHVEVHFWRCRLSPDLPDRAAARDPFTWTPIAKLTTLQFPEANDEVIRRLTSESA